MRHSCLPPDSAVLDAWLKKTAKESPGYGHLLLEQRAVPTSELMDELRAYFESAHADARTYFHHFIGLDLHPDADDNCCHAQYPGCLPVIAKRGLFGEVLAGLVTESYSFVGQHVWKIPVFLFRYHGDVERYLFDLARDQTRERQVYGRHSDDFLAIVLSDDGSVARILAGEAKWRDGLTDSVFENLMFGERVKRPKGSGNFIRKGGVWDGLNKALTTPHGLRQLQRLIEELAPEDYAAAIVSLDAALTLKTGPVPPRSDLFIVVGNGAKRRKEGDTLLPSGQAPVEYKATRDLQVVEVILEGGTELIEKLYSCLYATAMTGVMDNVDA
jgi:hypothetical protein